MPALLVLGRRWIFWPAIPRPDHDGVTRHLDEIGTPSPTTTPEGASAPARRATGWARLAGFVGRRPRATWVTTAVILLACAAFAPTFTAKGIQQSEVFLIDVASVSGQRMLEEHFDAGSGSPLTVIVPEGKSAQALALLDRTDGLTGAAAYTGVAGPPAGVPGAPTVQPKVVDGQVMLQATLDSQPDSPEAERLVRALRADLANVGELRRRVQLVCWIPSASARSPSTTSSDSVARTPRRSSSASSSSSLSASTTRSS